MTSVIVAIAAAAGLAAVAGWLFTRRSGKLRTIKPESTVTHSPDVADLNLSRTGPTVVHFSATWCGPCEQARRVVNEVCGDLGDVAHVEVDLDTNPEAARRHSVLSLPTTLIFDADGRPRYRTAGVPKAADLRSALVVLLA